MPQRNDASSLLSDVLVWMKYARNIGGRRETWPEIVARSAAMHKERFPQLAAEIDRAFAFVEQRKILPSMRSLQFAGKAIDKHQSRMYNCLARETRFITSTGVKSFEDFEDGDVVEVLTHKGRWREAVVRRYGEQPLQKITFHRGRTEKVVFATKNHRWILFDEEETTEIAAKDILFPIEEMKSFDYEAAEPLEKLYWCYGFVFGDGTRVKKKDGDYGYSMVRLCANKAKFADRFKEVGFKTSENLSCGGDVFAYTGTYLKSPPRIEEDGISLVSAFVDGYLCADGHAKQNKSRSNEEGGYRGIQCTGEEYIRFIREAFESCGYFILSERDLTGQKTNHGTRPATSHFSLTRKIGHRKDMAWSCASVEQTDRLESVWCLEVEEDKSFVLSGGIVTGNCCYAPLQDFRTFAELFFNLLCGTGTGYSVEHRFLSQLPHLADSFDTEIPTATHRIEDSIEGWSDAVLLLLETYAKGQSRISFDYSAIRPKGTPLKTTGGYAPGHEPLQRSLEAVEGILQGAMGRQLRPIEAHDIMCHLANAVYAGGIRRAAMICFFDRDDEEMLCCKEGEWWRENSQRARANNSAVLARSEVSEEEFIALMQTIQANNTGEPGVFWTVDPAARANPCVEASLDPYTFCNLATVNVSDVADKADFLARCEAAALISTLQASFTNFSYLSERWSKATRKSSLLGVSLTGLTSRRLEVLGIDLAEGAERVKQVNAQIADLIGIPHAHRTTLIKPEGTAGLVLRTSSGIHAYHSPYYLRGITVGKDEPIYPTLQAIMPENLADLFEDPDNKAFAYFPIRAPQEAISRHEEDAISLLERAKECVVSWILTGHRVGGNPHNISLTVSVKEHEWADVIAWMWQNRDHYTGIAPMPYWGGTHPQLPFVEVDEATFDLYLSRINGHFDALQIPEEWRTEALEDVAACVGGVCEIL